MTAILDAILEMTPFPMAWPNYGTLMMPKSDDENDGGGNDVDDYDDYDGIDDYDYDNDDEDDGDGDGRV